MGKGRLVSRPTEEKALANWTKTGLSTKPTYFPNLEPAQRNEKLLNLHGQFAIQYPSDVSPQDRQNWTDLVDDRDFMVSTAPAESLSEFIVNLKSQNVNFKVFTI